MTDFVDARLLVIANLVVAAACLTLVLVTGLAKAFRERAARREASSHAAVRPLVITVAAGEDDDGEAAAALRALGTTAREHAEGVILGMLPKIRGEPAAAMVTILGDFGAIERAVRHLGARSVVARSRATWLLGLTRDPRFGDLLRSRLSDRNPEVRLLAVEALGKLGYSAAATDVIGTLHTSRGRVGVPAAIVAESLMSMGPDIAPALAEALADDDPAVRDVAAKVARHGLFGQVVPALRRLVDGDASPVVRASAAEALGRIGGYDDVAQLTSVTTPGHEALVRRAGAAALGELGQRAAVPSLVALLDDDDRRLAEIAATALLELGQPGRDALTAAARSDGDGAGNAAAAFTLDIHRLQTAGRGR